MKVIVPKEVQNSILNFDGNKTRKMVALKIYTALILKSNLRNSFGYFPVPSTYLKSINLRYYKIIEHFIKDKIIDIKKTPYQDENDIFNTIYRKSYNTEKGICMKYKFLIDTTNGREVIVDMKSDKSSRWYDILENSLSISGFDSNITRDVFGRRVHHTAIRNYKEDFIGFYTIDAVCSQPHLLYLYLKKRNIIDFEYNYIFENDLDFYREISYKLGLDSREEAKDLFLHWLNGNGYVPNFKIHQLFPSVSNHLKKIKLGNYKNSSSLLQRIESKIWIDDLLNNIPCDFAIPIHDCLIVRSEDADNILNYCKSKYPELKFDKKLIK